MCCPALLFSSVRQGFFENAQGLLVAKLHRAVTQAHQLGHFGQRLIVVVSQDDQVPQLFRHPPQRGRKLLQRKKTDISF